MITDEQAASLLEEPIPIELPKERSLFIPLRYKEPKYPLLNRADRRYLENQLIEIAARYIKQHVKEAGPTYGRSA